MCTGWSCSYQVGAICDLLKKPCNPGDKGCTLYGKAVFSNPYNPSNEAVKRREGRREEAKRDETFDPKSF